MKRTSLFFSLQHEEVTKIVHRLGSLPAIEHSRGQDVGKTILESSKASLIDGTHLSRDSSAIALMDVLLAAHRDYNKQVLKHVQEMRKLYPKLTFHGLALLLRQHPTALTFVQVWGHNDEQKYLTLCAIVERVVPLLDGIDSIENDCRTMQEWGANSDLLSRKKDVIGAVANIGIATFQHLRMTFGVSTIKPDQQVNEVLQKEFGLKVNDAKSILAVEEIATICGHTPLMIEQIFVRYGSVYYRSITAAPAVIGPIVKKLKSLGVAPQIISEATGWSSHEVQNA